MQRLTSRCLSFVLGTTVLLISGSMVQRQKVVKAFCQKPLFFAGLQQILVYDAESDVVIGLGVGPLNFQSIQSDILGIGGVWKVNRPQTCTCPFTMSAFCNFLFNSVSTYIVYLWCAGYYNDLSLFLECVT